MKSLQTVPTKTLEMLWNGIHKQDGLIQGALMSEDGSHCALGSCGEIMDRYAERRRLAIKGNDPDFCTVSVVAEFGLSIDAYTTVTGENDLFEGTDPARRIHMLQFIGKELMSRDDIEVGFIEKLEAVS